jgi:DNA repair protein RecO (recombination protein O)
MPTTHVYTTEALVLRHTNFGEADRILTLISPPHGKIRAIAKGARKVTSHLASAVDLVTRGSFVLATGRELDVVTQAVVRERFDHMRESLWHATAGFAVTEALDRALADREPHPALYALAVETFRRLDADAAAWLTDPVVANAAGPAARGWATMRFFDLVLLDLLGYRPAFHRCVACESPLQPVEENGFNAELGGALCPSCTRYSSRRLPLLTLKVLRLVQTTEWDALPVMRLDARTRDDVDAVLEAILALNLERSLTSWSLLHQARP